MEWMIAVGSILILIELLLPGFGIFGLSGLILLMWGVYDMMGGGTIAGITISLLAIFGMLGLVWFIRVFPKTKLNRNMTLVLQSTKENGYDSHPDIENMLGKEGVARTVLRPSGTIIVDGVYVDAVTEGEFYEPGTAVQIIAVTGGRIVVRKR